MFLDLTQIRSAEEHVERVYQPEALAKPDDDYVIVEPVGLSFDVFKSGESYRVAGRVKTTLELTCSRCLDGFRLPVDGPFDVRFLPHSQNLGEGELEVEDEELDVGYFSDESIDLGQLVREQFYLAIPMKPLCREDCRGLCPVCGVNLNSETCSCRPKWEDPRLAPLEALIKPDKN
jgi:uncharacterized protein